MSALRSNFDSYTPLRIGDVPALDIEFIDSVEAPVGLGEPGTTVVAPAIGNAIFATTGARLRHLPIRPAAVLQALASQKMTLTRSLCASNKFPKEGFVRRP